MYRSVTYVCYSFLLISNKFCDLSLLHGGGGQFGQKNLLHCAPSLSPRAKLWALDAHVHETTYEPLIDTALYEMLLMRASPLLGQAWEGVGPS
jgi:hypothetical protein